QISKIVEHSIILIVRADTHKAHLSDSLRNLVLSDESRTSVGVSVHEDRTWGPVHSLRWVNVIIGEQHFAALPGLAQAVPTEKPRVLVSNARPYCRHHLCPIVETGRTQHYPSQCTENS